MKERKGFKVVDSRDPGARIERVCRSCALKALGLDINKEDEIPPARYIVKYMGICDICKEVEEVAHPRAYHHPKFEVPIDWE